MSQSRRDFIKKTALTGAGFILVQMLSALKAMENYRRQ
jgi:hypothetical protein